jgi:hypothetical protein
LGTALLELQRGALLGLLPCARAHPQPGDECLEVGPEREHLVLERVRQAALCGLERLGGSRPLHLREREVDERARRLVALARRIRERVGLEEHRIRVGVELEVHGADVDQRVRLRRAIAEAPGERQRPRAPVERLVVVVGQHRELRHRALGAGQLGRRAENLEHGDRLLRRPACSVAVLEVPARARAEAQAPPQ